MPTAPGTAKLTIEKLRRAGTPRLCDMMMACAHQIHGFLKHFYLLLLLRLINESGNAFSTLLASLSRCVTLELSRCGHEKPRQRAHISGFGATVNDAGSGTSFLFGPRCGTNPIGFGRTGTLALSTITDRIRDFFSP